MYTRIALGKNAAMDVVSGESSGGYGQLLILYPMLFALQAFQLLIGEQSITLQNGKCLAWHSTWQASRLCSAAVSFHHAVLMSLQVEQTLRQTFAKSDIDVCLMAVPSFATITTVPFT